MAGGVEACANATAQSRNAPLHQKNVLVNERGHARFLMPKTMRNDPRQSPPRTGTQSIERAISILQTLSEHNRFGWQLVDLARHCGLDKGTTHRILTCLARERMVSRRSDGRYMLGSSLFELSLALHADRAFHQLAAERLTALASRSKTVATLYLRNGEETVCAYTVGEGSTKNFPNIGHRRPLIASVAGIAILITLKDSQAQAIAKRNLQLLAQRAEPRLKSLMALYRSSRAVGISTLEGQGMPGVYGYGLAVKNGKGDAFAAVVLSGSASDFPPAKLPAIHSLLGKEVEHLSSQAAVLFKDL